jgi:rod shape determining protein RodA
MKNNQKIRSISKKFKLIDSGYIINIISIIMISLITVYSATKNITNNFLIKEIIWIFIGLIAFIIVSFIDFRKYMKFSKIIYIFNLVLLLAVYFIGTTRLGATRWISLGPINIQPSEFAKIFIIITFSELLVNKFDKGVGGWVGIIKTGIHILIPFLLILKQPDLGTSLVLVFLYYLLIFLKNVNLIPFLTLLGINISLIPVAYFFFLKDYQRSRISVFLNPEKDILGSGWNVIQSKIAVGSGRLFGKGLFNGTQNNLKFLPESHTDFIFSVFSEEFGFVGAIILLGLYFSLIFKIISIGQKSENEFGKMLCFGVAGMIFFHSFVNMGMVMGMMPITGLPLLLMSYGGSSFLVTFIMLGIVHSVKINN